VSGFTRSSGALLIAAGAFWFAAGALYLATEAIAAAGFPGYSYARDYVSELGIPYPELVGGREVLSTRATVMNLGFILEGLCFALAATAFATARRAFAPAGIAFLLLAAIHALGLVVIGLVHSGSRELATGIHHWHVAGAAMAIVGGNVAIIAASRPFRRLGAPPCYCAASLALGSVGLLSLALLMIDGRWPIVADGLAERGSVYAITAWEILTGPVLLAWALRAATPAG
jgi:hypothetical membrane protein